jgi:tetratricopeptide (TPR) repeat protein
MGRVTQSVVRTREYDREIRQLLQAGIDAYKAGRPADARAKLEEAFQKKPGADLTQAFITEAGEDVVAGMMNSADEGIKAAGTRLFELSKPGDSLRRPTSSAPGADDHYRLAERYYESGDFDRAQVEAEKALAADPGHAAARALPLEAEFVRGRGKATPASADRDEYLRRAMVNHQQTLAEIDAAIARGVRAYNSGAYADSEREFRTVREYAKWLPAGADVRTRDTTAAEMLERARAARSRVEADERRARLPMVEEERARDEARRRIEQAREIEILFGQAQLAFERGNAATCAELCDRILERAPELGAADELRALARQGGAAPSQEAVERWRRALEERARLAAAAERTRRRPVLDDVPPETRETIDKLKSVRVTIDMDNAGLNAIADYLREVSGLSIQIDGKAIENPDAQRVSIKATDIPLDGVLKLVLAGTGLTHRVEGGVVVIEPQAAARAASPGVDAQDEEWRRIAEAFKRYGIQDPQRVSQSQDLHRQATEHKNRGDFEKARDAAAKAVQTWPENLQARQLLAEINSLIVGQPYYGQGSIADKAKEEFMVKLDQAQVEIANHIRNAERFRGIRQYDDAMRELEEAQFKIKSIPYEVAAMKALERPVEERLREAREARVAEDARVRELRRLEGMADVRLPRERDLVAAEELSFPSREMWQEVIAKRMPKGINEPDGMLELHDIRDILVKLQDFPGPRVNLAPRLGEIPIAGGLFRRDEFPGVDLSVDRGFDVPGTGLSSIDELGPGFLTSESARLESYDLRANTFHSLLQLDPLTGIGVPPTWSRHAMEDLEHARQEAQRIDSQLGTLEESHVALGHRKMDLEETRAKLEARGAQVSGAAPLKNLEGRVAAVSEEIGLVILSLGKDDGVLEGNEFTVTRGGEFITKIVITRVDRKWSAGWMVVPPRGGGMRVGDDISNSIFVSASPTPKPDQKAADATEGQKRALVEAAERLEDGLLESIQRAWRARGAKPEAPADEPDSAFKKCIADYDVYVRQLEVTITQVDELARNLPEERRLGDLRRALTRLAERIPVVMGLARWRGPAASEAFDRLDSGLKELIVSADDVVRRSSESRSDFRARVEALTLRTRTLTIDLLRAVAPPVDDRAVVLPLRGLASERHASMTAMEDGVVVHDAFEEGDLAAIVRGRALVGVVKLGKDGRAAWTSLRFDTVRKGDEARKIVDADAFGRGIREPFERAAIDRKAAATARKLAWMKEARK